MKKTTTVSMTGTALCMALGLVLPVLFHMVGAGPTFLPMHIPVLLCGLLFLDDDLKTKAAEESPDHQLELLTER